MTITEKIKALNRAGHLCADNGKIGMARIWWAKEIELREKRRKEKEREKPN